MNPFALARQLLALYKIRKQGALIMEEVKKPGYKTSELWLSIAGILVTIGSAAAPIIPAAAFPWIATVAGVLPVAYALARTIAKATPNPKDDAFLEALAAKLLPLVNVKVDCKTDPILTK